MRMNPWLLFSLLAMVMWGLWGFFPKLAVKYIDPRSAMVWEVVGTLIVGLVVLVILGFRPETSFGGVSFAILTGVAATLGTLFFFLAVARGTASSTVLVTAIYPLVTILLAAFFLKEPITLKQAVGMLFAGIAIVLFSL